MSAFEVALFPHVIGAMAFVSGIVVAGVAFEAARRRATVAEVGLLANYLSAAAVLGIVYLMVAKP